MIAQKPMNIFALIDEESVLGSGSDASLLQKLKSVHGKNEFYRGKKCLLLSTSKVKSGSVGSAPKHRIERLSFKL